MAEVKCTKEFGIPADEMWQRIGDFSNLGWVPGFEGTEAIDDGKRRRIPMGGGITIVEALLEEGDSSYTYTLEEGPLPVTNYRSTLSVKPAGEGCVVEWAGTFDPSDDTPQEAAEQLIAAVYDGGLDALSKSLK